MKAVLLLMALTFMAMAVPALAGGDSITYFSVSWIQPKTRKLTPIKVYYNGRFMLNRTMDIPYGSSLFVKLRVPKGRYINVCFRDDSSRIYDLPNTLQARRVVNDVTQFVWTMPRRFMPGQVEFYLALHANINPQTMFYEGMLDKTEWLILGETRL